MENNKRSSKWTPKDPWTKEELKILRKYYSNYGAKKVNEQINRSIRDIRDMARKLGIKSIYHTNRIRFLLIQRNNFDV